MDCCELCHKYFVAYLLDYTMHSPGFATCERQRRVAQDGLHELWSVVTQGIDPGDLLDEAVSATRHGMPPRLDGHLLDLNKLRV